MDENEYLSVQNYKRSMDTVERNESPSADSVKCSIHDVIAS